MSSVLGPSLAKTRLSVAQAEGGWRADFQCPAPGARPECSASLAPTGARVRGRASGQYLEITRYKAAAQLYLLPTVEAQLEPSGQPQVTGRGMLLMTRLGDGDR